MTPAAELARRKPPVPCGKGELPERTVPNWPLMSGVRLWADGSRVREGRGEGSLGQEEEREARRRIIGLLGLGQDSSQTHCSAQVMGKE